MRSFMYADGYVRIKIWGSGVERFLVMCSRKKMSLWDIEAQGKFIFVNMRLKDFFNCRKLARKAGIRAVVVERHGLPFFMPKLVRRSFMIVGFVLFLLVWFVSTNMLLHIRLEGNYSISEDVFKDFLKEQGVYVGMWKKDIPLEELEKEIRKEFDLVTWTSGKLDGTVLIISMKENEKLVPQEQEKPAYGSSIYATADGIISSIYVRNGVPMVKKGTEVKKGDLLVDGKVPVYNEAQEVAYYQYYEADADIGIETTIPVDYRLNKVYVTKSYTGRQSEGNYFFIGQKIYRNIWKDRTFKYRDFVLAPKKSLTWDTISVGFGTFEVYEYVKMEKEYTKEEAKMLLEKEFEKNNVILIEKGVQILEKNVTIDVIMEKWALTGTMKVIMPAFNHKLIEEPEEINDSEGI
ncbi:MAG: sporulation protein YqfD [Lachnospiraceae bacterium]|nr:sporulation protein YqfD [Lachnospiraceae bacterium]